MLANKGVACFPNQPAFLRVACAKSFIKGVRVYAKVSGKGHVLLDNENSDPLGRVQLQDGCKCVVHLCNTGDPAGVVGPYLGSSRVEFVTDSAWFAEEMMRARGGLEHPRIGLADFADSPADFLVLGLGALHMAPQGKEVYVEGVATVREARDLLKQEGVAEVILDSC